MSRCDSPSNENAVRAEAERCCDYIGGGNGERFK